MTLTRRDVAAMRLAYECLRQQQEEPVAWAYVALEIGSASVLICDAIDATRNAVPRRVLRVRLALLLRALLREETVMIQAGHYRGAEKRRPLRHRALWELAPPHEVPR